MNSIELSSKVVKFIKKFNGRITSKIKLLKNNPVPKDAKYLGRHLGDKVFRIRIGNFRVLYKIKNNIIIIAKIDKRERVY